MPQSNSWVPAEVAVDDLEPLPFQLARELGDGEHRRAGAFGDVHGVADMVAVAMGEEDRGRVDLVG